MMRFILFLLIVGFFAGCAYDSEEDLFVQEECKVEDISYSMQIVPILQTNCYGCHAIGINSGGVTLEGHANVLKFIDNGRLLGAIKHESGFSPMPQNAPMLPDCQIRRIAGWINDGAPNN